jgi:uncharacterized membrane protein
VARDECGLAFMAVSGCVVAVALTAGYFPRPALAAVPVLFVVLLAAALAWLLHSGARLQAAIALQRAALAAAAILALSDKRIDKQLKNFRKNQTQKVLKNSRPTKKKKK